MNAVMLGNVAIKVAWIAATVFLISNEHNYWAVATFIGALISGYEWQKIPAKTNETDENPT